MVRATTAWDASSILYLNPWGSTLPSNIDLDRHLTAVYGQDAEVLSAQVGRYRRDLEVFATLYGPGPVSVYRAPGRVNLIGEHTDYNHGYVLPVALDRDVLIVVRPRSDSLVRLSNVETGYATQSFRLAREIPSRPVGDWANNVQGAARLLALEHGPELLGCDALVDGAPPYGVPRGAGLSSSSALTVAAAVALAGTNRIALEGPALADACSRAEWYVGTRGGIMDHFCSVLGQRDHALFLDCRPHGSSYSYQQVPIPTGYVLIVVDSGMRHRNTGPHFNRRVLEGRIGVQLLRRHYPQATHLRDVNHLPWRDLEPLLPEVIHSDELRAQGIEPEDLLDRGVSAETDTFYVRRRCRHVITENNRVLAAVAALRAGEMEPFGRLMNEAHISARDDYEISTPEIEALVEIARAAPGTVGARLTGAGWGGCIVAVVEQQAAEAFTVQVGREYEQRVGRATQVFVCRSSQGAGRVLEAELA